MKPTHLGRRHSTLLSHLQIILAPVPDMGVKDPPGISSSDPSQEISKQDNESIPLFLSTVCLRVWLERGELEKEITCLKN